MAKRSSRAPQRYVVARTSFWAGREVVHQGEVLCADSRLVKGRETMFRSLDEHAGVVEQATAAPGERRVLPPRDGPDSDEG